MREDNCITEGTPSTIENAENSRWTRVSLSIRPNSITRLDKIVETFPFRSRSEAVEIALELFFETYDKNNKLSDSGEKK